MQIMRTNKVILTDAEILSYIKNYEKDEIPRLDRLWEYYQGRNCTILNRTMAGQSSGVQEKSFSSNSSVSNGNSPDSRVPIPYGRKITTTFTGYAYRPKYISYKPIEIKQELSSGGVIDGNLAQKMPIGSDVIRNDKSILTEDNKKVSDDKVFFINLMKNYRVNNEHIKTSRAGRNTAIFGLAYELLYIDKTTPAGTMDTKAEVKFFAVDPRQMILLHDYSSEPKKVMAIRFYEVEKEKYNVEVYYKDKVRTYTRNKENVATGGQVSNDWVLKFDKEYVNFFGDIPVVPYYFGDEMTGLIEPVIPLIDCYDTLISDSMNEFDRFAHAYLVLKKMNLVDPIHKKEPGMFAQALANLKRYRVFEGLDKDADVKFLTKDIPYGFIQFMTTFVQKQIHTQSHVPDFAGEKFSGASGIAIQRLLFDFENVCSDAEADFDLGLYERMRLISIIYEKLGRAKGDYSIVNIAHKRNSPLNLQEFANTANILKQAGFSRYLIADIMPDDVVPDVEEELERQDEEEERMLPTVEQMNVGKQNGGISDEEEMTEEEQMAEEFAQAEKLKAAIRKETK